MRFHVSTVAFLAACVMLSAPSLVSAYVTPSWYGQPGTTHQQWTFDFVPDAETGENTVNPALVSSYSNTYAKPTATITPGPGAEGSIQGWDGTPGLPDFFYGYQGGLYGLGPIGKMSMVIPGDSISHQFEEVWLQVVYYEFQPLNKPPVVSIKANGTYNGQLTALLPVATQTIESDMMWGAWKSDLYKWRFTPGATSVTASVTTPDGPCSSILDRIDIDTMHTPEPATLALLCCTISALVLPRRR